MEYLYIILCEGMNGSYIPDCRWGLRGRVFFVESFHIFVLPVSRGRYLTQREVQIVSRTIVSWVVKITKYCEAMFIVLGGRIRGISANGILVFHSSVHEVFLLTNIDSRTKIHCFDHIVRSIVRRYIHPFLQKSRLLRY